MLLVADIGNTTITIGVYDGEKLLGKWSLSSDIKRSEDEYGSAIYYMLMHNGYEHSITDAIVSCVVTPLTDKIKQAILKYFGVNAINVSSKIKTGVKLCTKNPKEIGADRIVNACYVSKYYKLPAIVVDLGTATTFDVINKNGEFVGGIISAGIKIQTMSLQQFTSKLPMVRIEAPEKIIADNTVDAMLSGIVRGHAAMIDGLIIACEKDLGEKVTTIATGGYSNIIADYLTRPFDFINENLIIDGLYELWKLNRG